MVGAGGVHFGGEARGSGAGELFGVEAEAELAGAGRRENSARLRHGKSAAVAENVAEFGEIFSGDSREPFAADEVDIGISGFSGAIAEFGGHDMCAEKCGNDFERLLAIEFAEEGEDFAFAGPVEAIAGFGFDSGGAVGGELGQMSERARFELCSGRGAEFADRIKNAATAARDFLVCGTRDTLFVFGGPGTGMNKMSVGIDEAGNYNAASEVEFSGATRFGEAFDAAARADGGDASVADEKSAVGDDAWFGEGATAARRGAAESKEFGAVGKEQEVLCAGARHFVLDVHGTEIRKQVQVALPRRDGTHCMIERQIHRAGKARERKE